MTSSPASADSRPMSRSEWVSTLPPWRRLLATFNWRPVYDIEQRTKQHELNALASEKRMQESEKQMLESEKRLKWGCPGFVDRSLGVTP